MAVVSTSLSSYVALSCCCLMAAATLAAAAASEPRYNAMFNLGDSTSDTGNLCPDGRLLLTGVFGIFARPPYGNTYFGKPTCLCSDGRVNVDFLCIFPDQCAKIQISMVFHDQSFILNARAGTYVLRDK